MNKPFKRFQCLRSKQQKQGVFLLAVFVFGLMWQLFFFLPFSTNRAHAEMPVAVTVDAPLVATEVKKTIWETIKKNIGKALQIGAANAFVTMTTQIAYQMASGLANYKNGSQLFTMKSLKKMINNAGDAAVGDFMDSTFQAMVGGDTTYDICNPKLGLMLPLVLNIEQELAPRRPRCTFSDIKRNNANYYKSGAFLKDFGVSFNLREHDMGSWANLQAEKDKKKAAAEKAAEDSLKITTQIPPAEDTGTYSSPTALQEEEVKQQLVRSPATAAEAISNPSVCLQESQQTTWCLLAPIGKVFTTTLVSQLSKRVMTQLFKYLGGNTLTAAWFIDRMKGRLEEQYGAGGSYRGTSSDQAYVDANASQFPEISVPTFTGGGNVDIVANLSSQNCGTDKDFDSCVISQRFGEAIRNKLTVRQALGLEPWQPGRTEVFLDPNLFFGYKIVGAGAGSQEPTIQEGISYSAMVVLRKYRIIPVTWEAAALYIGQYAKKPMTLGGLVIDEYEKTSSPFYHLIDPDWVLKAPEVQCAKMGYGEDVYDDSCADIPQEKNDLSVVNKNDPHQESKACHKTNAKGDGKEEIKDDEEYDDINNDTLCESETDLKRSCMRKQVCVDTQSCIIEDEFGQCKEYGYCTAEKNIWRFGASQCQPEYASCLTYQNALTGTQASYLRNTLAINDCKDDRALGCRSYCQDGQDGAWNCKYIASSWFNPETNDVENATGLTPKDATKPSLFFNNMVKQCSSEADGCQEFIRTVNGSNLASNADFEEISGTANDTATDMFGFCGGTDKNYVGKGCKADSECGGAACIGWRYKTKGTTDRASLVYGINGPTGTAAQFDSDSKTNSSIYNAIYTTINTGSELSGRRFMLTYNGYAPYGKCQAGQREGLVCEKNEECPSSGNCINSNPSTCEASIDVLAGSTSLLASEDQKVKYPLQPETVIREFLVGDGITDTELEIQFKSSKDCSYVIDQVKLQEIEVGEMAGQYTVYGASKDLIYMTKARQTCVKEAVGCKLYAPINGDTPVPGIIRESNICKEEYVGCRSFVEMPTRDNFELGYAMPKNAYRTGYYCQTKYTAQEATHPFASCDPTDSAACGNNPNDCLPAISLIPQTAKACSVQEVGCEEFTNLDIGNVAEAIQYYTKIRQCVKPESAKCKSYFTWEGSANTGFQLREYDLQESESTDDVCMGGYKNGLHCNPSDPIACTTSYKCDSGKCLGGDKKDQNCSSDAECVTNYKCIEGSPERPKGLDAIPSACTKEVFLAGDDPLCQQFFDEDNNEYFLYFDETISCTAECHPLRNSIDNQVYMAAPIESTQCSKEANGCKEYKGSNGNSKRVILDNNPTQDGNNLGWTGDDSMPIVVSPEAINAMSGNKSLNSNGNEEMYSSLNAADKSFIDVKKLTPNSSYIVSFWAKGITDSDGLKVELKLIDKNATSIDIPFSDNDDTTPVTKVNLSKDDWRAFSIGPVTYSSGFVPVTAQLVFKGISSSGIYISNIKLIENDSWYLVKGTAKTCKGEENCQTYITQDQKSYNLKTFERLCKQEYLGCEALINTQNSHIATPTGSEAFSQKIERKSANGTVQNEVIVPNDSIEYLINNKQAYCSLNDRGCRAFGFPELSQSQELIGFSTKYLINNPDDYEKIMCQRSQEYCEMYFGGKVSNTGQASGGEVFKNPFLQTCEYKSITGQQGKAWYRTGTDQPCPVRTSENFDTGRNIPAGQVCIYSPYGWCDNEVTGEGWLDAKCMSDSDCSINYPDKCKINECKCIMSPDAGQPILKNGYAQSCSYAGDPVCGFGYEPRECAYWVGTCPDDQHMCTQFVDSSDAKADYYYFNNDLVNTKDCSAEGVNPKRGCVAFEETTNTVLNVNSRKYCSDDINAANNSGTFYDKIKDKNVCVDNSLCSDNAICANLPINKVYASSDINSPTSCISCSTDLYSCNTTGNLPCCNDSVFKKYTGVCAQKSDGLRISKSCNEDSDCGSTSTYKCEIPAVYCDANMIVKVQRDRVCSTWLSCSAGSTVKDRFQKETQICQQRALCGAGEAGQCTRLLTSDEKSFGNLTRNTFCDPGADGRCENTGDAKLRTDSIDTISTMTGYSVGGFNWGKGQVVEGNFYTSDMFEYGLDGTDITVPNGDFEKKSGGRIYMPPSEWNEYVNNDGTFPYPISIKTIRESFSMKLANRFMQIEPRNPTMDAKVYTKFEDASKFKRDAEYYVVSFDARVARPFNALKICLYAENASASFCNEEPIALNEFWGEYSARLIRNSGNDDLADGTMVYLEFTIPQKTMINGDFVQLDNVSLKPVLAIRSIPTESMTGYAVKILEDPGRSGINDPYTYIPGVKDDPKLTKYGIVEAAGPDPLIEDGFNGKDDPTQALGYGTEDSHQVSLGTIHDDGSPKCWSSNDKYCHGWITFDFGASILVNKDKNDDDDADDPTADIFIKEKGGATSECYTVELGDRDFNFYKVLPKSAVQCTNSSYPDAFKGSGNTGEIDISTVQGNNALATGQAAARYVRITDKSNPNDAGAPGTPGVDIMYVKALSTFGKLKYAQRSCRAYPTERAEQCSYIDANTKIVQNGWEGYCVERHPTNPEWCVNWWPIDVIAGSSNIFGDPKVPLTPIPLFYCADTRPIKELPPPLAVDHRYVCLSDAYQVGKFCEYTYYYPNTDTILVPENKLMLDDRHYVEACFGNFDTNNNGVIDEGAEQDAFNAMYEEMIAMGVNESLACSEDSICSKDITDQNPSTTETTEINCPSEKYYCVGKDENCTSLTEATLNGGDDDCKPCTKDVGSECKNKANCKPMQAAVKGKCPTGTDIPDRECPTIAIVARPRAAALSLVTKGPNGEWNDYKTMGYKTGVTVDYDGDGQETDTVDLPNGYANPTNPDSWALGVAGGVAGFGYGDTDGQKPCDFPTFDEMSYKKNTFPSAPQECNQMFGLYTYQSNCVGIQGGTPNETTGERNPWNFLNKPYSRYCREDLEKCVNTLAKYWDYIKIYQWRDDGHAPDVCSKDNQGQDNNDCTDGWGGSCMYHVNDDASDLDAQYEVDDWSNIDSFTGQKDSYSKYGYEFKGYNGDYRGQNDSNYKDDEDYPLECTKLIQAVNTRGEGLPYVSRIQGALTEPPTDSQDVSGKGNADDYENLNLKWNYSYTSACLPYGATPYVKSLDEIQVCSEYDANTGLKSDDCIQDIDPNTKMKAAHCVYNASEKTCTASDAKYDACCGMIRAPLSLYHPYNPNYNQYKNICSDVNLGSTHYACRRKDSSNGSPLYAPNSTAPCRVCSTNSSKAGISCGSDGDCPNGTCEIVSYGKVCSGNHSINCVNNNDCKLGGQGASHDEFKDYGSCEEVNETNVKGNLNELNDEKVAEASSIRRLQQLFAVSEGEWVWDNGDNAYISNKDFPGWSKPSSLECKNNKRSGVNEYCYVTPSVKNIKISGGVSSANNKVVLDGQHSILNVQFETEVDADQMPVKKVCINWEGNGQDCSYEGNAQIRSYDCTVKDLGDENNTKVCVGCGMYGTLTEGTCVYKNYPKISIIDSWDRNSDVAEPTSTIIVKP